MGYFLGRMAANIVSLVLVDWLFGSVRFGGPGSFILAALILGFVNAYIRPLVHLLALPLTVLTFGFFALVVNALCLGLVAFLTPHFDLEGCFMPIVVAFVLSIVSAIVSQLIGVETDE